MRKGPVAIDSSTIEVEQSDGAWFVHTPGLGLWFCYAVDRWRHELLLPGPNGWTATCASLEGEPHDVIPPSPAFQDLRFENIGPATVEFQLLGQAGQGTYAAAIRFDGAAETIAFDIFARSGREGAALCTESSYVVAKGDDFSVERADSGLILRADGQAIGVEGADREVVFCRPASAAGAERGFAIRAAESARKTGVPVPRGTRWKYKIGAVRGP